MERYPDNEPEYIEQIDVEIGAELWSIRHDNTFIVLYGDEWEPLSHIIYIDKSGQMNIIFEGQPLMDFLYEAGWDYLSVDSEPSEFVKKYYETSQHEEFESLKPQDFN